MHKLLVSLGIIITARLIDGGLTKDEALLSTLFILSHLTLTMIL